MARKQAGNINVDFDAKTAGLRKAEGDVRRTANSMSRNFQRATRDTRNLTQGVRNLAGRLRGLSAFGGLLAGGFLGGWIRNTAQASAGMVELSIRTGESTTALEHLIRATEADGASRDKAARSIANWSRVVTEAADGSAEYADTFNALGLSARRLSLLPLTDQFHAVADAVSTATEEGRRFQALGLLTQLVGARNVQGFTAFFERGRFARNLQEGAALATPTREEYEANKELLQDFTNLSNVIRTSLIKGLAEASGGLSKLAEAAERNIPAGIGAAAGQGTSVVRAGAIVLSLGGIAILGEALDKFIAGIRALQTWGQYGGNTFRWGAGLLTRATFWLTAGILAIEQIHNFYRRFSLLRGVEPPDIRTLGNTLEEQAEAVWAGLENARANLARARDALARPLPSGTLGEAVFTAMGLVGDEIVSPLDVAELEAELMRWEAASDLIDEARGNLAESGADAANAIASTTNELAGLITDMGDLFRALAPLPEFVNPRFDIARHLEGTIRDPRRVGTLDLTGLSLRPAGLEPTPTPFHVLGDARELAAEFRVHEEILSNVAIEVGDALGDLVDTITEKDASLRDALANLLRGLSRAITSGVGAGLTDRLLVGLGLRAGGGYASGLTLVGERGPELLDFRNPAMVYSNAQLGAALRGGGGAGGVTINYAPTINAVDAVGVEGVLVRQRKELLEAVNAEFLHRSGYSNPLTQRYDAPGF